MENHIRLFGSVSESPFSAVVPSSAGGVTPSPLDQCSMPSPPPQYDQSPGRGCSSSLHRSQQREIECEQSQEPESQSSESVVPETEMLAPETQLVDSQTASPTDSMEPSLESPMTPNSGTRRGRKRRTRTADTTANKMQRGLEGIASVSHRRSILTPISENISGLVLKNHSKEIRNDGWNRCKRSLTPKAIHSGMWEV